MESENRQLSRDQINQNYKSALDLAVELVNKKFRNRGYDPEARHELMLNLAQSALADEAAVNLLKTAVFDDSLYSPVISTALDSVKKEMFPDLNKRRAVSLAKSEEYISLKAFKNAEAEDLPRSGIEIDYLDILKENISAESWNYLEKYILPDISNNNFCKKILSNFVQTGLAGNNAAALENKIQLFRSLYPQGRIKFISQLDTGRRLTEQEIVSCCKNVLCGIEQFYPPRFLSFEGRRRAAVIVRFIVIEVIKKDALQMLREYDSSFFIRYKIQNIYRMFNYSINRVLSNAFPDIINPWINSRTDKHFWESRQNRIEAVQWLVEEQLGMQPEHLKKSKLSRKTFTMYGLSYLFCAYYNSVSKAVKEAYPHLKPWQAGNVPREYWTEKNAADAVRWLMAEKGWQPENLPALYKSGDLNRRLFNDSGLAVLFEQCFSKNIYRAVSAAYPNMFKPWQFGRVSASYWCDPANLYDAVKWIARQEKIGENNITNAVRSRHLDFKRLKRYSIGPVLKKLSGHSISKLFMPFFFKEELEIKEELRIEKKLEYLIRKETHPHPLLSLLFYGFYRHLVQQVSNDFIFRCQRIIRRRERSRINFY